MAPGDRQGMRIPRALAVALTLFVLSMPAAVADHDVRCASLCLGSIQHIEGEGDCIGDSREYFFITGIASGDVADRSVVAGVGWSCEDHGETEQRRTGLYAYTWDENGEPTLLFLGTEQEGTACGVVVGLVGVTWEGSPTLDRCTLA